MNEEPEKTAGNDDPGDYEPTIRMARPEDIPTTRTRKIAPPPRPSVDAKKEPTPFAHPEKSSVEIFIEHLTGMFRRKDSMIEPVPIHEPPADVATQPTDAEDFPPLEEAFERGEELGAGGQARLFRGFDRHLLRRAAVKSLREEQCAVPELREKFISEAMITAQLDHPSIVPVYSIHRDKDNRLHLAMKLINGRPFQKYLGDLVRHYDRDGFSAREEKRSLDYRLEVFLSICDALEYAHNRHIMHCDLKPENIMIGESHEAYLMDWGLARRFDEKNAPAEEWHAPTIITGTPRFLAPEALRGERCDRRADIYAMGLILYEIVTLQYAYGGGDPHETVNRIRRGEMRPVTHRYKYPIPVDLRKIILKASAWDKEKRYKTMEEFSGDLRRFIRGEEVSANPDSCFGRLARWAYRHRRLMLVLVLAATTLGATAIAFSLYDRIQTGRYEAAWAEYRHHRGRELSRLLGSALGASRSLDRQISKMEYELRAVATEAMLLLNAKLTMEDEPPIYSLVELHDTLKRPASVVDSPGFGFTVDMDHIAYHLSPGSAPKNYPDRVRRLTLLQPMLMRAVVESGNDAVLSEENMEKLRDRALQRGVPLVSLYFGFHDGLFVTYPGELGIDGGGVYDHRKRPWYLSRVNNPKTKALVWGSPYLSVNDKLVLTCTLPMIDTKGRNHGIAAADVSLPRMIEELREEGNKESALLAKSLVDAEGNIVVDLGENFLRNTRNNYKVVNGKLEFLRYPDQELLKQIRLSRAGYVVRREGGREVVYVFAGMFSVPWVYIEKLDLDKLLRERGIARPGER